jgi:5'-deoxynucleotidase YfbR-like HD superfamily hydrolase
LKDELGEKFDAQKAIKIALVHDLVEIYTGDCWPSNKKEIAEKIDFVWKDNGAYIDKIIKKLNDLESKIDDLELALLLKE